MALAPGTFRWDQFKMGLDALQAYVAREGHAHVPRRHREGDFALGAWVIHCRKEHRRGRLSPERVVILEAMSGWTWDPIEDQFKMGLDALQAYVAREGHAHVPLRHREGDFALGRWVQTRRLAYRRGKLSPERIAALEGVLGWTWTTRRRSAI